MKMEPIVSSETSAIRTQTPGNYPKRNKLHLEHGESLKTRIGLGRLLSVYWQEILNNRNRRVCFFAFFLRKLSTDCDGILHLALLEKFLN